MNALPFQFSAASTAHDVINGVDLTDQVAVVTGGSAGIGLEITKALAGAGASVIVPTRDVSRAVDNIGSIPNTHVEEMDLSDLSSVEHFANRFHALHDRLDLVIANAGIMAVPLTRVDHGWESQFATNHLGHFGLVGHLWPSLVGHSARVVVVGSGLSRIHWEDMQFALRYDKWDAYLQSKTANRHFAMHLDAVGAPHGVRAFSVAPGYILTGLQRHLTRAEMIDAGWVDVDGMVVSEQFRSAEQGAATAVWAATSPSLNSLGGLHCEDSAVAAVLSDQLDPAEAQVLWRLSARLTGVFRDETES